MNVVFISPHFPVNFWQFVAALRGAGATPLAIADEPFDRLRPELQGALAEYYRVDDMHRYDEMVRAAAFLTYRHGKIDRIDSMSEHWLASEARLREDFNVPGLRPADLAVLQRKTGMKGLFEKAGVLAAPAHRVRDPVEARAFVKKVGYPLVAKPDIGVGASRTWRIETPAELESFLGTRLEVDYVLEPFVEGDIVTYDGLADQDGRVVFDASLRYSRGIMEVVNEDTDVWYHAARDLEPDLVDAGRRVVRAFDLRERFFHIEFFRRPDRSLLALEVNVRPPGGLTVDMWNYQNDANLYRAWADLLVHGNVRQRFERAYVVAYVGRKDRYRYALPLPEILSRYHSLLVHHEPVNDVFSAALGNYGFILRSPSLAELADAAADIQAKA
ncbi:MAG: carboxylate--amine ligase [Deltaproteobacteria bacterium]